MLFNQLIDDEGVGFADDFHLGVRGALNRSDDGPAAGYLVSADHCIPVRIGPKTFRTFLDVERNQTKLREGQLLVPAHHDPIVVLVHVTFGNVDRHVDPRQLLDMIHLKTLFLQLLYQIVGPEGQHFADFWVFFGDIEASHIGAGIALHQQSQYLVQIDLQAEFGEPVLEFLAVPDAGVGHEE